MIRTFNYTGRRRIKRRQVRITTSADDDGGLTFDLTLDLSEFGLPTDAGLFVEAYDRRAYMRFPWGTVGAPSPPADRRLSNLTGDRVLFRVKVVDPTDGARLLAAAEQLKPTADEGADSTPLLPVDVDPELGSETWRVEFGTETVLVLNGRIPGIKAAMRHDPVYRALVFPSILRQVLTRAAIVEECLDPEEGGWCGMWIRYAVAILGDQPPHDGDLHDVSRWIEDVVSEFARRVKLADALASVEAR